VHGDFTSGDWEDHMGLLDGVLGGLVGGGLAAAVGKLIDENGGVAGLVSKFEKGGLGAVAQSWVGTGANAPVSGNQVHNVFGPNLIQQLAAKAGMSPEDLANKLSEILPGVVDKMTPGGVIPKS